MKNELISLCEELEGTFDEKLERYEDRLDRIDHEIKMHVQTLKENYYQNIIAEMISLLQQQELTPHQQYLCLYCIHHQNMHIESLIQARQTLSSSSPIRKNPYE